LKAKREMVHLSRR